MELKITYRHIDKTPSIEEVINRKALKLKKYFDGKLNVHWICAVENDVHMSEVIINTIKDQFHAKSESDDLYKTIDLVEKKIEKQIHKAHDKMKEKIHRK